MLLTVKTLVLSVELAGQQKSFLRIYHHTNNIDIFRRKHFKPICFSVSSFSVYFKGLYYIPARNLPHTKTNTAGILLVSITKGIHHLDKFLCLLSRQ